MNVLWTIVIVVVGVQKLHCAQRRLRGRVDTSRGLVEYGIDRGFLTVRPNARIFWLLYAREQTPCPHKRPLLVWFPGGPGESALIPNFYEIGPKRTGGFDNRHTWLETVDLLFVDQPVGCGFSAATTNDSSPTTLKELTADSVTFMRLWFKDNAEFASRKIWIIGQSAGAMLTTNVAYEIHKSRLAQPGGLSLEGIGLADGLISPMDSLDHMGRYYKAKGLFLLNETKAFNENFAIIKELVEKRKYIEAQETFSNTLMASFLANPNFKDPADTRKGYEEAPYKAETMLDYVNGPFKQHLALNPNEKWLDFNATLYVRIFGHMYAPVIEKVDYLLRNGLHVLVYNGEFDALTSYAGSNAWIEKMAWARKYGWKDEVTKPFFTTSESKNRRFRVQVLSGYFRSLYNLSHYSISNAGHRAAADQPQTLLTLIQKLFKYRC